MVPFKVPLADTSQDKDKGIMKWFIRTNLRLKHEYGSRRSDDAGRKFFQHSVSQNNVRVLLPLFALYVWLFFSRKKGIFTIPTRYLFHPFSFLRIPAVAGHEAGEMDLS